MTISECVRSSPCWGVVKSLGYYRRGPVGLVHTQKIEAQSEKPTWTKALEFTQFACPCGTDPRLLSGEQRTSHFKLVTSVDDPTRTSPGLNGNLFRGQAKTHKIGADDDIPSKARSLGVSTRGTELGATRRKKVDGA